MKLRAISISSQYNNGNRKVLNNADMNLESGERVGLKAPSGFGKTTFCEVLVDYGRPDHGTVVLGRESIPSRGSYNPVQTIWQHPELSVNPRPKMQEVLRGGDAVEGRAIHGLGIEPGWPNRCPGELSGGGLRRFCMAKALGKRARFTLADEIGAMLDLTTQSRVWGFPLEGMKTRKLGLLAVGHSKKLLGRIYGRVADLRTNSLTVWV